MENNSMDLVHGAAIYEQDNFSVHNNMTPEDFLILVLGPKQQEDKVGVCFSFFRHIYVGKGLTFYPTPVPLFLDFLCFFSMVSRSKMP